VLRLAQAAVTAVGTVSGNLAFEAAKAALETMRVGTEYGALTLAQTALGAAKYGPLYLALVAAKKALGAAQGGEAYEAWQKAVEQLQALERTGQAALDAAQQKVNDVGRSKIFLDLQSAKAELEQVTQGPAAQTLESANARLEVALQGTVALRRLVSYVARRDFIDVRSVHLEASFQGFLRGDLFKATVRLGVLGNDYTWVSDFNAQATGLFVDNLFKKVLAEATSFAAPTGN
jgi:hypothetical protein